MEIINLTPFQFAPVPGRLLFPNHSLTLVIKGSFDLAPDSTAKISEEQLSPTGDEFYQEDEEQVGSVRYESDFAYYKPMSDLLFVGKCHSPNGRPVWASRVTYSVGERSRSLAVFGDRHWKGFLKSMSSPEPFTEMEIRYEKSYGGEGYLNNPIGKGYRDPRKKKKRKAWNLPNIEDVDNLIRSPKNQPNPVGFGPLGKMWNERASKMGSYKKNYLKERWPWFPKDQDLRFFNAASSNMQVEGYLKGDESLFFENLHPLHSQYRSKLPGLRIRAFLNTIKSDATEPGECQLQEVPLNLDTAWVDMECEKLVLVWRGWAQVQSEESPEVQHAFIMSEPVNQEAQSIETCEALFRAALAKEDEEVELEPVAPLEPSREKDDDTLPLIAPLASGQGLKKADEEAPGIAIDRQTSMLMSEIGLDLEKLSPEQRQIFEKEKTSVINRLTQSNPAKSLEEEQAKLEAQLVDHLSKQGIDPENLPAPSQKALAEQSRFMKEIGIPEAGIEHSPGGGRLWTVLAAFMPKMGMDPENLDPLIDGAKKHIDRIYQKIGFPKAPKPQKMETEIPKPKGVDRPAGTNSPWTRELVAEGVSQGDSFSGQDLSRLDLSGLELMGADFSGAILVGANLSNSNLQGANLKAATLPGANLTAANLEKASLQDADVTEGNLSNAKMTGADLQDALFEKAILKGSILNQVQGKGCTFTEADLSHVSFIKSDLSGADFSKSVLDEANFLGANLTEATLNGAKGSQVNLDETDLTELRASEGSCFPRATIRKAKGGGSMWVDADLTESNFSFSEFQGADFSNAILERTIFSACDMKFTRFRKANLSKATLIKMNLFEGSMEKANLTEADLRGSNLYSVEFLDADTRGAKFELANLKMTKLKEA